MKTFVILALLLMPAAGMAAEKGTAGLTAHDINDTRMSLKLTPRIKHRLLSNMRVQLAATRTIIGLIAAERFDKAATTARSKLAMSDDIRQIYAASKNEELNQLASAAQAGADELANTLQSKDLKKSLQALQSAMSYCVQCHMKFRQ